MTILRSVKVQSLVVALLVTTAVLLGSQCFPNIQSSVVIVLSAGRIGQHSVRSQSRRMRAHEIQEFIGTLFTLCFDARVWNYGVFTIGTCSYLFCEVRQLAGVRQLRHQVESVCGAHLSHRPTEFDCELYTFAASTVELKPNKRSRSCLVNGRLRKRLHHRPPQPQCVGRNRLKSMSHPLPIHLPQYRQ